MPDPDDDFEAPLAVLEREVVRLREGFAETRGGFAKQAAGMAQITALLTKIAGRGVVTSGG